ncbi:aminoglycoside 6'-acetyltransferase, partial [Salmonella enterica subsp. enterica serovar Heidelberg str. CFSAN001902]|nr:aminoglycoside 6'-acetyltransferase [Salmonella enterica subsp. enterica serovar Heidelberg str. CFSAN001902]
KSHRKRSGIIPDLYITVLLWQIFFS